MKKSGKNKFLIFLLLWPMVSLGGNYGFVNGVLGKAFLVDPFGNTKILKRGDGLETNSQVFVEEGGSLSFADYNDRQYDLAAGGHIVVGKRQLELKKGFIRVKSKFHTTKTISLTTINSKVSFTSGEGIFSFNADKGFTQLLSIDGQFNFENVFIPGSNVEVFGGQFSSISTHQAGGQPLTPAKIGEKSLNLAMSEFYSFKSPTRSLSSVLDAEPVQRKIIFVPRSTVPKAPKPLESKKKRVQIVDKKKTPVAVHIFGRKKRAKVKTREIASEKPIKETETQRLMRELNSVK